MLKLLTFRKELTIIWLSLVPPTPPFLDILLICLLISFSKEHFKNTRLQASVANRTNLICSLKSTSSLYSCIHFSSAIAFFIHDLLLHDCTITAVTFTFRVSEWFWTPSAMNVGSVGGWPASWGFGRSTKVSLASSSQTGMCWASKTASWAQLAGFGSNTTKSISGKAPHPPHPACAKAAGGVGAASLGAGTAEPISGPLMLLGRQAWGTCWPSGREQGKELQHPGSSLHRSTCLYVNMLASRAGLDLRVPLGLTGSVNISPGTLRGPQNVRLHLEMQGGFLQQTVSETSRRLAVVSPVLSTHGDWRLFQHHKFHTTSNSLKIC